MSEWRAGIFTNEIIEEELVIYKQWLHR